MIAYSRGSNSLAGAASLKHRMPAMHGTFRSQLDIAPCVEQQSEKLAVADSTPAIACCVNSSPPPSDPGLTPANSAR